MKRMYPCESGSASVSLALWSCSQDACATAGNFISRNYLKFQALSSNFADKANTHKYYAFDFFFL